MCFYLQLLNMVAIFRCHFSICRYHWVVEAAIGYVSMNKPDVGSDPDLWNCARFRLALWKKLLVSFTSDKSCFFFSCQFYMVEGYKCHDVHDPGPFILQPSVIKWQINDLQIWSFHFYGEEASQRCESEQKFIQNRLSLTFKINLHAKAIKTTLICGL